MLSIKKSNKDIPDLTEFTDEDGRKWIQTSTNDLFSAKELDDIMEKIDKDKNKDEIVLARFDFQKVNKEYYDTVLDLQARLKKQNEILKQLLADAKETIDKKNSKLKELVKYIRKLHLLLAYHKTNPDDVEKLIPSPDTVYYEPVSAPDIEPSEEPVEDKKKIIAKYTEVEETLLNDDGSEKS
ncbi:MAG: hypothetical protein JXN64_14895 [Spirochaetes bacterium]|nr:hypothetical protein [Spirochaetota bacterium]